MVGEVNVVDILGIFLFQCVYIQKVIFSFKNIKIQQTEVDAIGVFCNVGEQIRKNLHLGEPKVHCFFFKVVLFRSIK